jgi:GT2 family glycosyltransferase
VVVTRDRRELLRRCLHALDSESRPADAIVVVDNASGDGTAEMVAAEFPQVELLALGENLGGAGGFHQGMAHAYGQGHEWVWVMDDDTIVTGETLARLLDGAARAPDGPPLLLCSLVRWTDGSPHPMNVPTPRWRAGAALASGLAARLLLIRQATFVSLLVHRDAIERFGLPHAHYFIWGDDTEFTARVLRHEPGYLVPDSVAQHWTPEPHRPGAPTSDRFYYHARNSLLILRGDALSPLERLDFARYYARTLARFVALNWRRGSRWMLLARALRDGLRRDPRRWHDPVTGERSTRTTQD